MEASRRLRLGLELTLLACVALLIALAIRTSIRTGVLVLPPPRPVDPGRARERVTLRPLDAYRPIVARDVFNAGAGGDRAGRTGLRLLGVALDGAVAHAVLDDPATGNQVLVRVGDEIAGGRITSIGWNEVVVARGGREETLELVRDQAPPRSPRATPAPPAAIETPAVRRTAANAFLVDRRQLDTTLDGLSGLMTELRAVPEERDGRPAGFRIFQLRDEGLFRRLGLENGDVVERVNGEAVGEPAALLGFLERLRSEPRVAIDIVRDGEARTLVYDLR